MTRSIRRPTIAFLACLLACLLGGCGEDENPLGIDVQASSAVATSAVPAGSQGTNDSRFFPIGLWMQPGGFDFVGDSGDTQTILEEQFQQVKRWGFNTVFPINLGTADLVDTVSPLGLQVALAAGGLNVVGGGGVGWFPSPEYHDLPHAQAIANAAYTARGQAPAFLYYYPNEEEPAEKLPALRLLTGAESMIDEAHGGMTAIFDDPGPAYDPDKMLGLDTFTSDRYPFELSVPYDQDPLPVADFVARLDRIWQWIPADKAIYWIVQAHGPDYLFRMPSAIEVRYQTYAALAHGARGIFYFIHSSVTDSDAVPSTVCQGSACPQTPHAAGGPEARLLAHELGPLGPWIAEARRDDVSNRCGQPWGATPMWTNSGSADCDLTTFKTVTGQRLFMLVNRHATAQTFTVYYDKASFADAATILDLRSSTTQTGVSGGAWWAQAVTLAPGDGKLFQALRRGDVQIRLARGAVQNPIAQRTPMSINVALTNVSSSTFLNAKLGIHVYPPDGGPTITVQYTYAPLSSLPRNGTLNFNLTIPTGPGTPINKNGTWRVGLDVVQGTIWSGCEQTAAVMIEDDPLLVDTFDQPSFKRDWQPLRRWLRTPLSTIREGALALNGGGLFASRDGSGWTDYTMDFDLQIDAISDTPLAGWAVRATADGGGSGYVLALAAYTSQILRYKLENGVLTNVYASPVLPVSVIPGTWMHVRTTVAGSQITTWLNGQQIDSFSDAELAAGGIGFYASEGDGQGNGIWRQHVDNIDVHTTGVPPAVFSPQNLTVAPSGHGLKLTWERSGQEDIGGFRVLRATSPVGPFLTAGLVNDLTFTDVKLSPGTTYWYAVVALNLQGAPSPMSNQVSAAALADPPGTRLTANADSMKKVTLSWPPVKGQIDHFDVFRADGPAPATWTEDLRIGSTADTTWSDDPYATWVSDQVIGPRPYRGLVYAVRAVDVAGNSGPAALASVIMPGSHVWSDDFDIALIGWFQSSGWQLSQSSALSPGAKTCGATKLYGGHPVADAAIETDVQIQDDGGNADAWEGIALHRQNIFDNYLATGYAVRLHTDGTLDLYRSTPAGVIASMPTGLDPRSATRRLRVETHGPEMAAYIDGVKYLDVTDASLPAYGYSGLETCDAQTRFDNFDLYYRESFVNDGGLVYWGSGGSVAKGALTLVGGGSAATPHFAIAADFVADFDMQILSENDGGEGWGGFTFRKSFEGNRYWDSGYLVYLRANGEINLYRGGSNLASAPSGVDPMAAVAHVRVEAIGSQINVYVNRALKLQVNDSVYTSGYFDLSVDSSTTRFQTLQVY